MRPSVKSLAANAALAIVSIALTYLVASFLVFRFVLSDLSLNLRPHFPDLAEVFAQTSKSAFAPRDYTALLGDSYAEGQGDGLLTAAGDRSKVFHSAHVLHASTGRDVISLGIGGAGSAQAMVRMPTRTLRSGCFLYPHLDAPKQMLVYFYEGNDLDENGYVVNVATEGGQAPNETTRDKVERYIAEHYAVPSSWRCFTDLAETAYRMGRFLLSSKESWETLRKASAGNKVESSGVAHPAPALQKPPFDLDASRIDAALTVFDVSLAWLRQAYPQTPITMVYVPSPAAIYRHAGATVDTYTQWPMNEVRAAPVGEIYAVSQRTCEQIRRLTLAQGVRFIDMRPVLRAAAAKELIHGQRDWNHFNEAGYRVFGEALAATIDDTASTGCRDWD